MATFARHRDFVWSQERVRVIRTLRPFHSSGLDTIVTAGECLHIPADQPFTRLPGIVMTAIDRSAGRVTVIMKPLRIADLFEALGASPRPCRDGDRADCVRSRHQGSQ
jgi:hypothetical protein